SCVVSLCRHGIDVLHEQASTPFDLVMLVRMLPVMEGWEVLKQIQAQGTAPPVLLLTAKASIEDRVTGLEAGADDYLVKPFAFAELLARIRTLLRRGQQPIAESVLTLADLEIDLIGRRVYRGGQQIRLTAKEFALLELLVRHQGQVLPRSMIASMVWDINFDSDTNVIDVAIRRLRSKVDEGYELKLIHTVRGMGYVCDATSQD
ncbi:MAG: winged helix-turn-helix domain-containing protein, partial [Methylophaga sp.]|nr:winged helix-turn-helix domain-containing protein [Methylophaga sp.]